jgi:hypothetical protein
VTLLEEVERENVRQIGQTFIIKTYENNMPIWTLINSTGRIEINKGSRQPFVRTLKGTPMEAFNPLSTQKDKEDQQAKVSGTLLAIVADSEGTLH